MKKEEGQYQLLEEAIPVLLFKAEVAAWAKRMKVKPTVVHVRPMKQKWASCSSQGRVTFNKELLSLPANFRAEVIVHDLLHLKVPNHGRVFKALLKTYLKRFSA